MADPKGKEGGGSPERPDPSSRVNTREDFLSLFKRGQEFTEELLQENERLRFQVASLQEEAHQTRRHADGDQLVHDLMTQIRALEDDRQRLLDHYRSVEEQNRDYSARYGEIEEAHNNLANLYVSSYQLHSTLAFGDVVQIICEILLNLIGAEEFALYLLDEEAGVLFPLVAEGRDVADFPDVKMGEGRVGHAVLNRDTYVAEGSGGGSPQEPLAIIPLVVGERVVGALVLLKLLVQKEALGTLDMEIFSLLAAHASTALRSSAQDSTQRFVPNRAMLTKMWQAPARPEEA